jgi:hypothetical protein
MHDGLLVASSSKGAGSGAASFWVTLYTLHRRASAPPAVPRLSAKSLSVGSARQVPLYQRVLVGERGKRHDDQRPRQWARPIQVRQGLAPTLRSRGSVDVNPNAKSSYDLAADRPDMMPGNPSKKKGGEGRMSRDLVCGTLTLLLSWVGDRTFAPSGSVECLEMECFWGP